MSFSSASRKKRATVRLLCSTTCMGTNGICCSLDKLLRCKHFLRSPLPCVAGLEGLSSATSINSAREVPLGGDVT